MLPRRRQVGLFGKIFGVIITLVIFANVALVCYLSHREEARVQADSVRMNLMLARMAAKEVAAGLTAQDMPYEMLKSLNDSGNIKNWFIVRPDGKVHASSDHECWGQDIRDIFPGPSFSFPVQGETALYLPDRSHYLLIVPLDTDQSLGSYSFWLAVGAGDADGVGRRILAANAAIVLVLITGLGGALWLLLRRIVTLPLRQMIAATRSVAAGDLGCALAIHNQDELGQLAAAFNRMMQDLKSAHEQLEERVVQRTRQLSEANQNLVREITERHRAEKQLAEIHHQLMDAAHRAGMAEIATDVLHNVGNVLNSVNVSVTVAVDGLRNSKIAYLIRSLDLLEQHSSDLGWFLTENRRGKQLPGFLRLVANSLVRNHELILEELQSLTRHITHIKTIVAMQQSYAGVAGVIEAVSLADLLDDALKLNAASLEKYHVEVVREYEDVPKVHLDKQKALQILVNLVTNAKDALLETDNTRRSLTASIRLGEVGGKAKVWVEVRDNGGGIAPENLVRIFSHGFTTKKYGHGFGLHSSANAAKDVGAKLTAHGDGLGRGAVFVLELPFQPAEVLT